MIIKSNIITHLKINSVDDLYKLKPFMEDGALKINKSQIARELEVDRRTVDKYINGFQNLNHESAIIVLMIIMKLSKNSYLTKISRYSIIEEFCGNI